MTVSHVLSFSGGIASAYAAKRLIDRYGCDGVVLLFADTLIEDEDLYRFIGDISAHLDIPITRIADGRDPWQVFRDERFIGNSRVDPCSRILKRELLARWMDEHAPDAVRHLGIWLDESERLDRVRARSPLYEWDSPLLWSPAATHKDALQWLNEVGVAAPRLYGMGFSHNNCGGFCVKAGHAQFANLLRTMPCRYAHHESEEQKMREFLGRDDVTILTDRRGGVKRPMTLREFRERLEAEDQFELWESKTGCGCAVDD